MDGFGFIDDAVDDMIYFFLFGLLDFVLFVRRVVAMLYEFDVL